MYGAPGDMVDAIDFIVGTYLHIDPPKCAVRYFAYVAYVPNLVDILVSDTYLAIICEVAGCVLASMCKKLGLHA